MASSLDARVSFAFTCKRRFLLSDLGRDDDRVDDAVEDLQESFNHKSTFGLQFKPDTIHLTKNGRLLGKSWKALGVVRFRNDDDDDTRVLFKSKKSDAHLAVVPYKDLRAKGYKPKVGIVSNLSAQQPLLKFCHNDDGSSIVLWSATCVQLYVPRVDEAVKTVEGAAQKYDLAAKESFRDWKVLDCAFCERNASVVLLLRSGKTFKFNFYGWSALDPLEYASHTVDVAGPTVCNLQCGERVRALLGSMRGRLCMLDAQLGVVASCQHPNHEPINSISMHARQEIVLATMGRNLIALDSALQLVPWSSGREEGAGLSDAMPVRDFLKKPITDGRHFSVMWGAEDGTNVFLTAQEESVVFSIHLNHGLAPGPSLRGPQSLVTAYAAKRQWTTLRALLQHVCLGGASLDSLLDVLEALMEAGAVRYANAWAGYLDVVRRIATLLGNAPPGGSDATRAARFRLQRMVLGMLQDDHCEIAYSTAHALEDAEMMVVMYNKCLAQEGMHRLANHCWASLARWRSEGRDLGDLGAHSIVVSPAVLRDLMQVM